MSISWREPATASGRDLRAASLGARAVRIARPELLGLVALTCVLNLWDLGRNGWANTYYSAAVRSMAASWHDFLFASLDRSGVMTVDKPPLALWVQALSVRVFGYHPLSVLVPQALMGVATVLLVYDLVRRRFGRAGAFAAGFALALTPITVAVSRHNNPDALLVLCCVAALWCAVRGFEGGRTRWLVLAGVFVGLGFETKMLVALVVVPGIALAWLYAAPAGRGRLHALRQLLIGGGAMALVAGAWPALVELTPAADRPWVSGTSDNGVLSLIFGYNGLGRVEGQSGGPGGFGGATFGGSTGPARLLNESLGGQAGWLLGFALVALAGLLLSSRLRARDPRSAWLLAVGGAFATAAVLFSFAGGIFHPYYVALLAPFTAALVGGGVAGMLGRPARGRVLAALAIAAGVAVEIVVKSRYPGQLGWLAPLLLLVCVPAAALVLVRPRGVLAAGALAAALLALMLAPGVWAFDTLGHATSATFPAGGPASASQGAFGAGPGGAAGRRAFSGGFGAGRAPGFLGGAAGGGEAPQGPSPGAGARPLFGGAPPAPTAAGSGKRGGALQRGGFAAVPAFGGGFGADASLSTALSYVRSHGGGTLALASQSEAASAIVSSGAAVAGIGGFSGRESTVSVAWLAKEVSSGHVRWVLAGQGSRAGLPGDRRAGSSAGLAAVARACTRVGLGSAGSAAASSASGADPGGSASTAAALYDCAGRGRALTASAA